MLGVIKANVYRSKTSYGNKRVFSLARELYDIIFHLLSFSYCACSQKNISLFFPNFLNLEVMILYYNMMEMKYAQLHFTTRVMVELGKYTKLFTR